MAPVPDIMHLPMGFPGEFKEVHTLEGLEEQ